jgi:phage terminase large subunit
VPEVRISLTTKQSEFDRLIQTTENVLYGGAKGGGKSHGLREIMLKGRLELPHSRGVIFRKTYPELYGNHIDPLLTKFPVLRQYFSNQNKEIRFDNGSVLAFRHCQHESDLGLHQGQEYTDLGIDEVGEWPEDWFWTLKGSNRTGRAGCAPRCLLTGNPGGLGHKWLKRLFIDRNFRSVEKPENFGFVSARVIDNPALMQYDPGYIDRLKANRNPMLVKAYLEGSWDIQAGQFFDMVSRETHMVRPFEIPDYWERTAGFDHGYNHPAAWVWLASDTDGNVYVYREYVRAGRRTEEIVADVMEFPDTAKLGTVPAGWDCWSKHGGPSIEEKITEASGHSMVLEKADIDRQLGAAQLRDYLAINPKTGKPRLQFFETCPITFECVARMTHDPKSPEDVLKVDAVDGDPYSGDDPYDAVRYAMMGRPRISQEPVGPKPRHQYFRNEDDGDTPPWTAI